MLRKILVILAVILPYTLQVSAQTSNSSPGIVVAGSCVLSGESGLWLITPDGTAELIQAEAQQPQWGSEMNLYYVAFDGTFWSPATYHIPTQSTGMYGQLLGFSSTPEVLEWSNDGRFLAYIKSNERTDAPTDLLYVVDDTGMNANLPAPAASDVGIAWSPDSGSLAYQSSEDGQIHVQSFPGGEDRVLTNGLLSIESISWSPDGSQIAFVEKTEGNLELFIVDVNTQDVRSIDGVFEEKPWEGADVAWSPDGATIAVLSFDRNYLATLSLLQLSDSSVTVISQGGQMASLRWLPDSRHLATIDYGQPIPTLFILPIDGSEVAAVAISDFIVDDFAFSPDLTETSLPSQTINLCTPIG
jgi:WD40 repeat protein